MSKLGPPAKPVVKPALAFTKGQHLGCGEAPSFARCPRMPGFRIPESFMLEIFLVLIVGLIGVGGATFHYACKEGASFVNAFAGALLVAIAFIGVALWVVNECELAWYLRQEVRAKLTEQEWESLRAEGLICPTAYSFDRAGKRLHAFVVDGWRGAKVYVGED